MQSFLHRLSFKNKLNWQKKTLGEVSRLFTTPYQIKDAEGGGLFPLYGYNGQIGYVDTFVSDKMYFTIVKDGNGVGKLRLLPGKSHFTNTLNGIQGIEGVSSTLFLYYLATTLDFKKYIRPGVVPHLYYKEYKELSFYLPPLPEQEKIGYFFLFLDDYAEILEKKRILFTSFKESLIKKLIN